MRFIWRKWSTLTTEELYAILRLRSEVFVVEQDCPYQDLDGLDQGSWHCLQYVEGDLAGYLRLLPAGLHHEHVAIGRVVTSPAHRRKGRGRPLMEEGWRHAQDILGPAPVYLWAQSYLRGFYESLGYAVCGAEGEEDGIPHFPMLRNP